ncbi:hypothetical protein [Campylobacter jejuni]|uniref:hypothetical protein n=1 Tax=Campylobacter jejuni TaxID=197 RepID=UPI0021BF8D7F|nr:hypothetical protein [Campylobacter jejuni]
MKTAYIHIGTPKTGTTSIQKFLTLNREILKQNGYYYPNAFDEKEYWYLEKMIKVINDHKILDFYQFHDVLNNDGELLLKFNNLKNEINSLEKDYKIILSSEGLYHQLSKKKEIYLLKKILLFLGFQEIFIIVYFRDPSDMLWNLYTTYVKNHTPTKLHIEPAEINSEGRHLCDYRKCLENYSEIFGISNVLVNIYDPDYLYRKNIIFDFLKQINYNGDTSSFIIPNFQNISLNYQGVKFFEILNKELSLLNNQNLEEEIRWVIREYSEKYLSYNKNSLRWFPAIDIFKSYIPYFTLAIKYLNEKGYTIEHINYEEKCRLIEINTKQLMFNWDYFIPIVKLIINLYTDLNKHNLDNIKQINSQNNIILQQTNQIHGLNETLENKENLLTIKENQIHNLNETLENKNQLLIAKQNLLKFQNNYGKAKTRIQNQLSYKLGQALILNSKSVFGFLSLPFIILSIVISHKQEQKAYKFKIKKNPNLALPPLETYHDYNEALKEKECFTYKLGEEFIKASKNWYGGGYIKFYFKDVPRLKREINQERK